jgi:predicted NBD/HSP70 family sugar kinase
MYIVADIGGTKMRIARSRDLTQFDEPIKLDTPHDYGEALDVIRGTSHDLAQGEQIAALAIGVASALSADKRSIYAGRNLGWGARPVADDIASALATTVHMENDAALVGLGEAIAGAGASASIIAYITVSTGVNGVRIVDGSIDRSAEGFEIGGQYLNVEEPLLTFEDMVSGTAVQKIYGKPPRDLGKDNPLWVELAQMCAFGVHNTILHWSPNRVVLGGSMFNDIGISVEVVAQHVQKIMKKFPLAPEIVHSSLGDFGGLHGGLEILRQHAKRAQQ